MLKASSMSIIQGRYVCVNIGFKSIYEIFESQRRIQQNKDWNDSQEQLRRPRTPRSLREESSRTRIETVRAAGATEQAIHVSEKNPAEQGLKQDIRVAAHSLYNRVSEKNPAEQGLKPKYSHTDAHLRGQVSEKNPAEQGLKHVAKAAQCCSYGTVSEKNPAEQGLKHRTRRQLVAPG